MCQIEKAYLARGIFVFVFFSIVHISGRSSVPTTGRDLYLPGRAEYVPDLSDVAHVAGEAGVVQPA